MKTPATWLGFLLVAIGAYFLHQEMSNATTVHTEHVYAFVVVMVIGAGIITPGFILGLVQRIAVIVPWSGKYGNRVEDVPLEKAPQGTPPGTPAPVSPPTTVVVAVPKDPSPGDA